MLIAESTIVNIEFSRVLLLAGIATAIGLCLSAVFVRMTNRHTDEGAGRGWPSRALYLGFAATIGILAITSFGSVLRFGHMSCYALLAHLAGGGTFVFLLLAIAALYLPHGSLSRNTSVAADHRWWVARWSAWILVLSGLVTAGTMFLSMLPVLDTRGLVNVATLHSYSGLTTVIAACIHGYALLCTRLGWR